MNNINVLQKLAGANWNNQYVDRDLNFLGRCALGRVVKLVVSYTGCEFIRSKVNTICSVNLVKTAETLTRVMKDALSEESDMTLDEKETLLRNAAGKFNQIAVKTKINEIDVEAIIKDHQASLQESPAADSSENVAIEPEAVAATEPKIVDCTAFITVTEASESIDTPASSPLSTPAVTFSATSHLSHVVDDVATDSASDSEAKGPRTRRRGKSTSAHVTEGQNAPVTRRKSVHAPNKGL